MDEERLCKLKYNLQSELPQVLIFADFEGTYIHIIYDGKSVCKITVNGGGYNVTFTSEFNGKNDLVRWLPGCKTISRAIQNAISDYEKGQKNMMTLSDLRNYILQEIGNFVTAVVKEGTKTGPGPHSDRIKVEHCGWEVCSIYRKKTDYDLFTVIFYEPFICRDAGYSPIVDLNSAEIPKAIKNRINICENNNRIDINVNADDNTVAKAVYMMTRGNGKTRLAADILKSGTFIFNDIKDVIFNDPATIVFWTDGSKTVVKCQKGETFDPEKGLAMAISKKMLGNDYGYYETFAKHIGRYNKKRFNKALEEAKKIPPDEIVRDGVVYKRVEEK